MEDLQAPAYEGAGITLQTYRALYRTSEQIGAAEYVRQTRAHRERGRSPRTFRFTVTAEHQTITEAMSDRSMTDERAMALLHIPEVHRARFDADKGRR